MKKLGIAFICSLVLVIASSSFASNVYQIKGATLKQSQYDFKTTVTRVKQGLKQNHFKILKVLNHYKIAKKLNIKVQRTVSILFDQHQYGSTLIQANPALTLFMPMSINIWKGNDGKVYLNYWTPATDLPLNATINPKLQKMANKMSAKINAFTDEALNK
jgi:uncharacterized protein (DUF302 family)